MITYPEYATYTGFPGQNDRWTDISMKALEQRKKETVCARKALLKISPKNLKGEERVSYDLALKKLDLTIEGNQFDADYLPITHMTGLHMDLADMLITMPTQNLKDYEDRLSRLRKVPELAAQTEALMREGLRRKATMVKKFMERVPAQFDQILTAKEIESPLYSTFKNISAGLTEAQKNHLREEAQKVIAKDVYPALKKLKDFIVKEYIPGCREGISWSEMPQGKAWYAYSVKYHTSTKATPNELHGLGLQQVAKFEQRMNEIREGTKFRGDQAAFHKFLLSDSQFTPATKEELLSGYRDIAKRIDAELPRLFKKLPRLPYGVKAMPDYKAANSPAAYYQPGSLSGARAGYFEANTSNLKGRQKWEMEDLTLHEAVPGHHLQISLAQEIEGLPEFRKNEGPTSFVEGWALYSESLGEELGLYKDPYSLYGYATGEMWRAVRLVVDTGMHEMGWSRDQSIEYFLKHIPKSRTEAEVEIDRYIIWPGQALAYKVGQLKFRELRERAQKKLGERFDVREFHEEVLSHGAIPLDVLEAAFERWLASKK